MNTVAAPYMNHELVKLAFLKNKFETRKEIIVALLLYNGTSFL